MATNVASHTASYRCMVPVGAIDLHAHLLGPTDTRTVTPVRPIESETGPKVWPVNAETRPNVRPVDAETGSNVRPVRTGTMSAVVCVSTARAWLASSPDLPVLLVLHGGPGGDHRGLVAPLSLLRGCYLLFVDLRGHGLSGRPATAECTPAQMADDLEAVRTALGIEPPRLNVLGVSFGATVALTFADRHRNACARLLLSSAVSSFHADADWVKHVREHGTPEQAQAAAAIVSGTLPSLEALRAAQGRVRPLYYARPTLPLSGSATHLNESGRVRVVDVSDKAVPQMCSDEAVPDESLELVNWWYRTGSRTYDARPFLPSLTLPTLIMAGCADPLATPEQARTLATSIPRATLHLFERSGHLPQLEEPTAYRAAIGEFIGLADAP